MSPERKYRFSEDDDRLIRRRYDSRTETIDELAALLRLPRWVIRRRAQTLGVARCKEPRWTEEEEQFLESGLPRLSVTAIAKKLGRSTTAVALKAKRLGLRKRNGAFTARALAQGVGVDDHVVARWITSGLLTASHRHSERERDMHFISHAAVKQFVRAYPLEFDIRKVDQLWFVDLLVDGVGRSDGRRR